MTSKAAVNRIIETLKGIYPDGLCSLQYKKDYELLFAVRLSAQCTDERVNKVTPALYARFPTLESFAEADPAEVGEYIHSCGFYNGKARDIVACAQKLVNEYGGRVPGTMEELTGLPGVGRKTANLILGDAFGQPMSATPTASASRDGWGSPTAPKIPFRWSGSCGSGSLPRSPTTSATGWCSSAGIPAPPAPPSARAAP